MSCAAVCRNYIGLQHLGFRGATGTIVVDSVSGVLKATSQMAQVVQVRGSSDQELYLQIVHIRVVV